jgi:hypothetical protein
VQLNITGSRQLSLYPSVLVAAAVVACKRFARHDTGLLPVTVALP